MKKFISVRDFPKNKIYVLLEKNFRRNLINAAMKKFECNNYFDLSLIVNKKFGVKCNGGDIKYWVVGERVDKRTSIAHPKFMPLWLALFFINSCNISNKMLNKYVVAYRSGGKGLIIDHPILPIRVTPELDSIIIHLFADGTAGDFTPSYTQKDEKTLRGFVNKLENSFGKFSKSIYLNQGKYQVKFPKAITDILSSCYAIKSYYSYDSQVPNEILQRKDKMFKLACILAFIVDEGNIRDVISVYSVNKNLISDIRKLVLDCGYGCSALQFNKKSNSFLFTLSTNEAEKLFKDIKKLSLAFPNCRLYLKEENLRFLLKRRSFRNSKNNLLTRETIINSLKKESLTAQQISKKTYYAYCTIIHNLNDMLREGKLKRIMVKNKTYFWRLV